MHDASETKSNYMIQERIQLTAEATLQPETAELTHTHAHAHTHTPTHHKEINVKVCKVH